MVKAEFHEVVLKESSQLLPIAKVFFRGRSIATSPEKPLPAADVDRPSWLVPSSQVRLHGLKAVSGLNGAVGTVAEWDPGWCTWKIILDDGRTRFVKAENLDPVPSGEKEPPPQDAGVAHSSKEKDPVGTAGELRASSQTVHVSSPPPSTHVKPSALVRMHGLKFLPALNGQVGRVVEWDESWGAWKIVLDCGNVKIVKAENLEPVAVLSGIKETPIPSSILAAMSPENSLSPKNAEKPGNAQSPKNAENRNGAPAPVASVKPRSRLCNCWVSR
jgi:hypothetical protein